ncbi:MAG: SprB repeat-containing protein [Bacteroidales bacterium]|nr:SprB repeat-containing protein [Bacteroidales bacterium]MCF8458783.1 SprB repeat-containing protein [Bacteroidales bacterium]
MKKLVLLINLSLVFGLAVNSQPININTSMSASQYFTKYFPAGGIEISYVIVDYASNSCNAFFAAGSSLDTIMAGGFLMTSGKSTNAIGPNNHSLISQSNSSYGDATLQAIVSQNLYDAAVVQISFIPKTSNIEFRYVFASEEYPDYLMDDAFGCFINGPNPAGGNYYNENIALIPGTTSYVGVLNINPSTNSGYLVDNGDGTNPNNEAINYDGFTTPFTATASVIPNQTYNIKLVIADGNDSVGDSGVFLEAGSFTDGFATGTSPIILTANVTDAPCYGGVGGSIDLTVTGGTPPYNYLWSNGATTQDISNLSAGGRMVRVTDSLDNVAIGVYYIDQPTAISIFSTLTDYEQANCGNGEISLVAFGGTPPYSYLWSDGQTNATATGLIPSYYTITVTDSNNCNATAGKYNNYLNSGPLQCFPFSSEGTLDEIINDICVDNAGNVVVTGYYKSPILVFGTDTLTNQGGMDIFVAKYNSSGSVLWAKSFGGISSDVGTAVTSDTLGNICITGYFRTPNILFDTIALPLVDNYDIFLARLSPDGIVDWAKGIGGTSTDYALDVASDNAGNFYITGYFSSTTIDFTIVTLNNTGNSTAYVAKYNSEGTPVWVKKMYSNKYDYAFSIASDATGNLMVCGSFNGPNITCDGLNFSQYSGATNYCGFFMKINQLGTVSWIKGIKTDGGVVFCNGIDFNANGEIVMTGKFSGNIHFTGYSPNIYNASGGYDMFIAKYNPNGVYINNKRFGGNGDDIGKSIQYGPDGNIYSIGNYRSSNVFFSGAQISVAGNEDVVLIKLDTGLVPMGISHFGGYGSDLGTSLSFDLSGDIIATGYFSSTEISGDSCIFNNYGGYDGFITKGQLIPYYHTLTSNETYCTSDSTGSASISLCGGKTPYTFLWSNGETLQNIDSLTSGVYYVTIKDANSFTLYDSVTVSSEFSLELESQINGGCFGMANGYIDLTVSGTSPFSILWSNSSTTEDISNLSDGIYSVTVSNANCSLIDTFMYEQSPQIFITEDSTNIYCFGGSSGEVAVFVTGGTGNYFYQWSNGGTDSIVENLSPGTYLYTVSDDNNCSFNGSMVLTQPNTALTASYISQNVSCIYGNDGFIDLTVSGGTTPYSFQWSNGLVAQDLYNITAGQFSVTITDMNGCEYTLAIEITMPAQPIAIAVDQTNVSYAGASDGAIDITVSGGTPPYTYLWNAGQTTEDLQNLPVATYFLTVTDANGCKKTKAVAISQPSQIGANEIGGYTLEVTPNPANDIATILLHLPQSGHIKLCLFDLYGNQIEEIVNDQVGKGKHCYALNCNHLASGLYSIKLFAPYYAETKILNIIH